MKKVLITGANGFTGRMLLNILAGSDWEIIPMTQVKTGLENEITVDFTDEHFIDTLRSLPAIDAVVHLATRVGWDGSSRAEMFQPNVLATAQLVDWARRQHSYFVFASAAFIAGSLNLHITPELGTELNTDNDYLYCKWLAEEIIRTSGIRHGILRISGIFGKEGPAHLGINNAIKNVLAGKPPIRHGESNIKRNYIYVKDLCQTIRFCLDQQIEGWHLVAGKEINTIAAMLQTICDILLPGTNPEVKPILDRRYGHDQIVLPSPLLPPGRSFEDAICDIKFTLGND
ncbi:MAG: NAD(P)-dependent oxidoreductase [Acidobacteria bacterium]|jgi:nucleoside-diphosphate-sugar epimerase|nr:NAD(P)-dependent oxidoreductase [Acidobacteriota bacterium]